MTIKEKVYLSAREITKIHSLTAIGMLLAIRIIFGAFANSTMVLFGDSVKITLNFLPIAIAAIMFGPVSAGLVGALGDFLAFFLNSAGGSYFPGFTINGLLTGFIFGLFLYKTNAEIKNIVFAWLTNTIFIEILLSAYWVHCLKGNTYLFYLGIRFVSECIKAIPTIILMITFCKASLRIPINKKK